MRPISMTKAKKTSYSVLVGHLESVDLIGHVILLHAVHNLPEASPNPVNRNICAHFVDKSHKLLILDACSTTI